MKRKTTNKRPTKGLQEK